MFLLLENIKCHLHFFSGFDFICNFVYERIHLFTIELDAAFTQCFCYFITSFSSFSGANKIPTVAPTAAPPMNAAKKLNAFILFLFYLS